MPSSVGKLAWPRRSSAATSTMRSAARSGDCRAVGRMSRPRSSKRMPTTGRTRRRGSEASRRRTRRMKTSWNWSAKLSGRNARGTMVNSGFAGRKHTPASPDDAGCRSPLSVLRRRRPRPDSPLPPPEAARRTIAMARFGVGGLRAPTLFVCWVGCHCWLVQQCRGHGWASQPWHPTI